MIRLNNKKTVFKGPALLIFAAILINLTFSTSLTALARNDLNLNLQDAAAQPGTIRTPIGSRNVDHPRRLPHLPSEHRSRRRDTGRHAFADATPNLTPPGSEAALFLNTTKKTTAPVPRLMRRVVSTLPMWHMFLLWMVLQPTMPTAPRTARPGQTGGRSVSAIVSSEVQLALTSTGHPRLLMRGKTNYDTQFFQYAACDVNCTNAANWTISDVTTSTYSPVYENSYSGHHYFALDNLDRPRFLYRKTIADAYYVYCDIDCTSTVRTGGSTLSTQPSSAIRPTFLR